MIGPFELRFAVFFLSLAALGRPAFGQTINTTATFNNVGITITLATPTSQSLVRVFLKASGAPASEFREAHPLSHLSPTQFAGSVFNLASGTTYDFELTSTAFSTNQYFSATTRSDNFPDATNTTYHVSAITGDDSNNGLSPSQPFRTLAKALSVASAGAKILLYDGTYYEGDLSAPRSGTSSKPIVIQNAPGAKPVLSGVDTDFVAFWTLYDAANHLYRTPCAVQPENAYLNGGQFYHYQALADLLSHPWPQPGGYFVDGAFLYARFPGDMPPGTNILTLPAHTTALTISQQSNLQIRGLEFCFYGLEAFHRAIYIDGGDSNVIDHCYFHHNGVGVALKRAANFNTIQHCVFTEFPIATWSWHAVKDGGTDYESGGVLIYGSNEANRGNVIRYCTFTNMFDGSHLYSEDATGPTDNLDFYHNLVEHCVDDAIETDGAGSNCRIYFNEFRDFLTGISVAPCALGPTYIFRNILADWRSSEEFTGYPFKFNVSSSLPIQWVYLYHNTCITLVPDQHAFWFKQYSNWTNVTSRNNIFAGTDYALESQNNVTNSVDLDYDCLFTSKPKPVVSWGGVRYNSLGEFATVSRLETHGLTNQPVFLNTATHDYYLPANSPLLDRAAIIPGINDDYLGRAPDLGALEHGMQARSISVSANGVNIEWQVGVFGAYQLQYATNLLQPAWTAVGNPVQAEGTRVNFTDAPGLDTQRFYRLAHSAP